MKEKEKERNKKERKRERKLYISTDTARISLLSSKIDTGA